MTSMYATLVSRDYSYVVLVGRSPTSAEYSLMYLACSKYKMLQEQHFGVMTCFHCCKLNLLYVLHFMRVVVVVVVVVVVRCCC